MHTENKYTLSEIDYGIFIIMFSISIAIGVYFEFQKKRSRCTDDHILKSRSLKTVPVAISILASQIASSMLLLYPVESVYYGIQSYMFVPTMLIATIMINYITLPVFYNTGVTNAYEYLELRFDKRVRKFGTSILAMIALIFGPVTSIVSSLAFSQLSGINPHVVNGSICVICAVYTMLGGIQTIVWTDVLQATIMYGSLIILSIYGIIKIGGLDITFQRASEGGRLNLFETKSFLTSRTHFWSLLINLPIVFIGYVGLNQVCVQRLVAVPSLNHARRAMYIFWIGYLFMVSLNILTGIILYATYYLCDPLKAGIVTKMNQLFSFFVMDTVGHLSGLPGLFIAAIFSASLSTMSALFNTLARVTYKDLIMKLRWFQHSEFKESVIMKILILAIGIYYIFAGLVLASFADIFMVLVALSAIIFGISTAIFSLGMLTPWANAKGAFYGALTSIAIMTWIAIGGQMALKNGSMSYPFLPTSIEGCDFNITMIPFKNSSLNRVSKPDEPFILYKLSYNNYGLFALLIVWIVGLSLSFMTGGPDSSKLDKKFFSPCIYKFLSKDIMDPKQNRKVENNYATEKDTFLKTSNSETVFT